MTDGERHFAMTQSCEPVPRFDHLSPEPENLFNFSIIDVDTLMKAFSSIKSNVTGTYGVSRNFLKLIL